MSAIDEKKGEDSHPVAKTTSISDIEKEYRGDGTDLVPGNSPIVLPARIWLVAFVEFAERWTYYGTVNVFTNYMRAPLPPGSKDGRVIFDKEEGVAGALGLGTQKAFAIRTFNSFWVYCTPFVGAFVADLKLGRYYTILVFSLVCLAGHIILVGSASPSSIAKPDTALGLLVFSIVIMGLGAGAIKSCVSPLIAEQYTGKLRKETLASGEVVIKSPALTYQSVYLWFYLFINAGACGAISASFLARDNGYWSAYLVPTCIFVLVPGVLFFGKKFYVITPPRGSILLETLRVVKLALGKRWSFNPIALIKNIKGDDFWDVAKPSFYEAGSVPAAITWDDEFVGEVSRTVKACYVFLFFPFYWLCYSQIDNNLSVVSAALTLHGTPNDLVQNLNPITLIVFIPIFDLVIYPFMRKMKINFSPVKRIAVGFWIAGLAMIYAAVLEKYIYETSPCHDNLPSECTDAEKNPLPSHINVWVVAGPYMLVALSEIFASITSLEYAFTKAPKRMRSVVMAFSQFQSALSSALNFALVAVNVENKFTWLFGSFAVVAFCIGILFIILFRGLDKAEAKLNAIGTGDREGFAGETKEMTTGLHGARVEDRPADLNVHNAAEAIVHPRRSGEA
ncbi:peptide/h+ symporter protein [Flagelloscypha sp. PMI_526]|nr:peptide/h+ symporter protein [Flagelloscypha sp. PMI_526]